MKKQIFDFAAWRKRILEIKDQNTHSESLEFWSLVDMVDGMNDAEVTRTLFQTFTNKPDHGVKESVYNQLGAIEADLYYRIYFEELLLLKKETEKTGWYILLASYPGGDLSKNEWDNVVTIVKSMLQDTQKLFVDIISDNEFIDNYDWAEYVLRKLGKS